jgi:hypothetical protein
LFSWPEVWSFEDSPKNDYYLATRDVHAANLSSFPSHHQFLQQSFSPDRPWRVTVMVGNTFYSMLSKNYSGDVLLSFANSFECNSYDILSSISLFSKEVGDSSVTPLLDEWNYFFFSPLMKVTLRYLMILILVGVAGCFLFSLKKSLEARRNRNDHRRFSDFIDHSESNNSNETSGLLSSYQQEYQPRRPQETGVEEYSHNQQQPKQQQRQEERLISDYGAI